MRQTDFTLPSLITTADWLLLSAVLVLSLGAYGFRLAGPDDGPLKTVVRVGDQRVAEFPLSLDTTLVVKGALGEVKIVQQGGEIWFEHSPCKLKICEKMGHVHRAGEVIVCAPGKVMARVESSGETLGREGLDAIAR